MLMADSQQLVAYLQGFLNKARAPEDFELLRQQLPFFFNSIQRDGFIGVNAWSRSSYCVFCYHPGTADNALMFTSCGNYHTAHSTCLQNFIEKCYYKHQTNYDCMQCPQCKGPLSPQSCWEYLSYYCQIQGPDPLPALASSNTPPFTCDICYDEGQASREVTLNCKHVFHKACLKDFFDDLVDRRQVKESDIACPKCQRPIETRFLQLISPERFTEYSDVASLQVMDTLATSEEKAS